MSSITIKIEDHLSPEEIKGICADEIRKAFYDNHNRERILSNLSYYIKHGVIDSVLSEQDKEVIKVELSKRLLEIKEYDVFRKADLWGKDESAAYKILQEAVKENRDLIMCKVKEVVQNFNYRESLHDDCLGIIEGAIIKSIKGELK